MKFLIDEMSAHIPGANSARRRLRRRSCQLPKPWWSERLAAVSSDPRAGFYTAFEEVGVDHTAFDRLFEHAAER